MDGEEEEEEEEETDDDEESAEESSEEEERAPRRSSRRSSTVSRRRAQHSEEEEEEEAGGTEEDEEEERSEPQSHSTRPGRRRSAARADALRLKGRNQPTSSQQNTVVNAAAGDKDGDRRTLTREHKAGRRLQRRASHAVRKIKENLQELQEMLQGRSKRRSLVPVAEAHDPELDDESSEEPTDDERCVRNSTCLQKESGKRC